MYTTRLEILRQFNRYCLLNQLPYCIVGRAEQLENNINSDIDIIISQYDMRSMHMRIRTFCKMYDYLLIQCVQHAYNAFCYVIAWFAGGYPEFIKLDICGDYYRRGRLLLSAEYLLAGRIESAVDGNGTLKLFVASPSSGFLYYLIKKIEQSAIHDDHGLYLHNQWNRDTEGCRNGISRFWKKSEQTLLAEAAETNDWTPVNNAIAGLRRSLHGVAPLTWRGLGAELMLRVRRVMRPAGLVVAVSGRDAIMKRSVLESVETRLSPAFSRCVRYNFRSDPPGFYTGKNRKRGGDLPGLEKHEPVASLPKRVYCRLHYITMYLAIIRWKKVYSTLILYDKWQDDIAVEKYCSGIPLYIATGCVKHIHCSDVYIAIEAVGQEGIQARDELSKIIVNRIITLMSMRAMKQMNSNI